MSRRLSPATIQRVEHHAYDRAANLAKSYAEHWKGEARTTAGDDRALAQLKAGHWRIIENERISRRAARVSAGAGDAEPADRRYLLLPAVSAGV